MDYIRSFERKIFSEESQQYVSKTVGGTALAGICGYGGTFFFTTLNPVTAAIYFSTTALVTQLTYRVFEKMKESVKSPMLKHTFTAIQLLQIPVFFYLFHGVPGTFLSGATKLEMITATAYFTAIPVFFHLGIMAWNEPTVTHITAAIGVMLPLANGLGNYAKAFR